jgi:hypothetical protein
MNVIFNILMIYGLTFVIGMFVAGVIWLLYNTMNSDSLQRFRHREAYHEMKRLKHKKIK